MDKAKLIDELLDKLIELDSDPGEIHTCPVCGGKIHIWFGAYQRFEQELFGATVKCEACGIQMAFDYATSPPSWVKRG